MSLVVIIMQKEEGLYELPAHWTAVARGHGAGLWQCWQSSPAAGLPTSFLFIASLG